MPSLGARITPLAAQVSSGRPGVALVVQAGFSSDPPGAIGTKGILALVEELDNRGETRDIPQREFRGSAPRSNQAGQTSAIFSPERFRLCRATTFLMAWPIGRWTWRGVI